MRAITDKSIRPVFLTAIFISVTVLIFIYRPLIIKLQMLNAKNKDIELKINRARKALLYLKQKNYAKDLIRENEISMLMDKLTRLGEGKGVRFISITPKRIETIKDEPYDVLPIEIEVESNYKALGEFLGSLNELHKGPVIVKEFDIKPTDGMQSILESRLILEAFILKQKNQPL